MYDWVHEVLFDYQQYLVTLADRAVLGRVRDEARVPRQRRFVQQYRTVIEEGLHSGCFRPLDPGIAAQPIVQGILGVGRSSRPDGRLSRGESCDEITTMLVAAVRRVEALR